MSKLSSQRYVLLFYVFLAVATFMVYSQLHNNGFINYDDDVYVTENPHVTSGLSRQSVVWAFTKAHCHMWHPLASLSHILDYELYGLKPAGHHITSLIFHIGSVLLLFGVLKAMTGAVYFQRKQRQDGLCTCGCGY